MFCVPRSVIRCRKPSAAPVNCPHTIILPIALWSARDRWVGISQQRGSSGVWPSRPESRFLNEDYSSILMRLVNQFLSRSTWRLHLAPVFHSLLLLALHCVGSAAQVVQEGACQSSAAGVLAQVARVSEGTDICIQAPQNGCAQHHEQPTVACFPVPVDNVLRNDFPT